MEIYRHLSGLLVDIESDLRNIDQWSDQRPTDEAFNSDQPFFVDTMDFPQWLQFVFIARIKIVIKAKSALPDNCGVAPMAEEYFRALPINSNALARNLKKLDDLISDA